MKNKSSEWIDDLDKQLLVCREEIENLLFKRDMGLPVNLENIKQGYRRQNDILSDPKLLDKLNKFSIKTPKTKRKIEVLRRKIIEAKISDSPSFQYYQNYIQQEITDFFSRKNLTLSQRTQILKESEKRERRKECFSLMGLFLDKQENNFREMILLANKLARNENFSDFCSAKSFSEEVNLEDMARILYRAKKKTDKAWKQILKNIGKVIGTGNIEQFDLYYGINQLSNQTYFLPEASFLSSLKLTLGSLSVDFDKLPIKITEVVNAPPAGVYALGLPKKGREREIQLP